MKLICLPYAGGSKRMYSTWKRYINKDIEIEAVELKGRGERFRESFYHDFYEAVDDIYFLIKDKIGEEEYAIFGHSMGAILAYELYYKILSNGIKKPKHIFFSGRYSPNIKDDSFVSYKMPNDEFLKRISELGGLPVETLRNKELVDFFLPILKNDVRVLETYNYKEKNEKIQCNITMINGTEDRIDLNRKITWEDLCEGECKSYCFPGNHFFINDHLQSILRIIEEEMLLVNIDVCRGGI